MKTINHSDVMNLTSPDTRTTARRLWTALLAVAFTLPVGALAHEASPNRLTFSARFGLNISAKFTGGSTLSPAPGPTRATPEGDLYNYDDGYVLTDISDNFGGQTWYWGYDHAGQISGDTILMSRSLGTTISPASKSFDSDPQLGGELTYNRLLGTRGKLRYGVELAANYLDVSLSDAQTVFGSESRLFEAYPFTPGTTPPAAPYQGTFGNAGFLIGDTSISSMTGFVSGAAIRDHRRFDADLWGFRLGPYAEWEVTETLNVAVSAGLAIGILDGTASWSQSGAGVLAAGRSRACDVLWGGYIGANASWQFSESWSAVFGLQYQNLGDYGRSVGERRVKVDLSNSIFITLGLGYTF
jgi:hypothetical protein